MNIRTTLSAATLAVAGLLAQPAEAAGCSSSFNLGSMGPPGSTWLYNDFSAPQHFDDCYNFTLNSSAEAFGLTLEWDASRSRDIDLTGLTLHGSSLATPVTSATPGWFSFNDLLAGAYQLIVSGNVTATDGSRYASGAVGYWGLMTTTRSIAAPVPEPETYAMLALGLGLVGWASRRAGRSAR